MLELFPVLAARSRQRAGLLSGGEQQMLAIGRALMSGPRLLLLDEPSLGLAPKLVERIAATIREIHAQGTAVVLVEQNAMMALSVADRVVALDVGKVALSGRAAEVSDSEELRRLYLGGHAGGADTGGIHAGKPSRPSPATVAAEVDAVQGTFAAGVDPMTELRVDHVGLRFGGLRALDDLSFTVTPGSLHALIGPNGAGKSSCFNVIGGLYRATEGTLTFGGTDLLALRPHQRAGLGMGRAFQNTALSPIPQCSTT